ncbi:hypothetical protein BGX29_005929 [Mortierella sp. GBA35]|nr:hypothetical protein BGX29_005929 [Mortierella sp. GBA35]
MTPAPSSSRNRRSATLASISTPAGPPPAPPPGHPGTYPHTALGHSNSISNHSPHSSFSSHSGPISNSNSSNNNNHYSTPPSSFAPPRASFSSSSRASPVGPPSSGRSGRERDQDAWNDSAWRSIFDAALVKAQQAVQLDELQETTLAANLYAQAANDLGRVIPMCSSEKKKQSMLAIQAIYLDRVTQLRDSSLAKSGGSHPGASPAHSAATTESNEGHNYRYSVNSRNMGYVDDQYQPQQYQHQQYQPHNQQVQQQQHYQSPLLSPVQQYQAPQFQQQQQHQEPPPQPQQQQSSGLRLFGKKRSKTQSSVSQPPPEFTQQFHGQGQNYNFNQNNNNNNNGYGYADPAGAYTVPFVAPPRIPSPPPVVSPIFMTHPPAPKNQLNDSSAAVSVQEQPAKSSKWRPFGKKKSKSLSNPETSKAFTPPPEMAPSVPVIPPHVEPEPVPVQYLQQQQEFQQQQHFLKEQEQHYLEEQQQQQQDEEVVEYRGEEFKNPARGDWYVESTPETPEENSYEYDEFENPAHYFDEEDEDVDPYYIADTKGRARAFEGQDTGVKDKGKSIKEPEAASESNTRKPLTHNSSSYSQEQSFSPKFEFSQAEPMVGLQTQLVNQDQPSEHPTNERAHTSNFTDNVHGENNTHIHDNSINGHHQNTQGHHSQETSEFVAASQIEDGEMAKSTLESVGGHNEVGVEAEPAAAGVATVEKTKTKRTWYGKKKKEKDPEKEKEKQKQKELDRLDTVARLMDDALFGAPSKPKLDKEKLKEKTSVVSLDKTPSHHTHDPADRPHQPIESAPVLAEVNFSESHISTQQDKDDAATNEQDESNIEEPYVLPEISEPYVLPEVSEPANSESGIITTTTGQEAPSIVSGQEAPSIVSGQEAPSSVSGQEALFVVSDPPKRSKSRHFSIFKSKKNKDVDIHQQALDGSPLSPTVTNDETKSVHSHHTRQSTYSTDRKVEPPVVVRPKEKEVVKKRDSDEYVPYEYQEELEGPLMERVEVPEHREVIGFVLPVEEIMDYTLEGNEEAALENWDSWVSQLESFEKVLSDKGLKKEKAKKAKKVKEVKPEDQGLPMSSTKANRSSIFGSLGRSDTLRSRNNTTLELNTQVMENRSLSMSTTLLDDIPTRPSFQSSRSGESEAPSQFLVAPQTKKRWWKRKETNSFYRASNALSTADLEQDQHLSALLRSQTQVRSSDNLPQDHGLMSMPISFVEPVTPVQELSKEAPAAMESVPAPASEPAPAPEPAPEVKGKEQESEQEPELKVEKIVEKKVEQVKEKEEAEEAEAEAEVAIAPMPKPKATSSKPKLLPISTPLPQLLKIESAEELWQYVQQAKTYATSRMNKGDKRSAAIALKRAQALEARWQEILLEMASSGEDTDELLEEDDEESSDSSEEVPAPVVVAPPPKKEKAKKVVVQAPVDDVEDVVTAPAPVPVAPVPIAAPAPTPTPVAAVKPITTVAASVANEDEDDEEENYAAHRRRNTISRSSSTIDKYSKYKTNKSATSASNNTNVVSSQASATEDNADAKSVSSTKTAATTTSESDSGRLGPEATLEQMLESKNIDHVKYYIQRMKTDTVTKARNGSKFAALEGMKNVKVLQQHLADLLDPKDDKEEEEEKEKEAEVQAAKSSVPAPSEERIITVQPTIQEEDEEEDEEDEKAIKAPTQETKEETKAPIEKEV